MNIENIDKIIQKEFVDNFKKLKASINHIVEYFIKKYEGLQGY